MGERRAGVGKEWRGGRHVKQCPGCFKGGVSRPSVYGCCRAQTWVAAAVAHCVRPGSALHPMSETVEPMLMEGTRVVMCKPLQHLQSESQLWICKNRADNSLPMLLIVWLALHVANTMFYHAPPTIQSQPMIPSPSPELAPVIRTTLPASRCSARRTLHRRYACHKHTASPTNSSAFPTLLPAQLWRIT